MRKSWFEIPVGTALGLLFLVAAFAADSPDAPREPRLLWQIGIPDNDTADLCLGRDGWSDFSARFPADAVYLAGRSDPKADWPYVQPGPADGWAGSRPHTFSIFFALEGALREGDCRLVIDLVDTHHHVPSLLRIKVNDRAYDDQTPTGARDESLYGDPSAGKEYRIELDIPADTLKIGRNRVTITTLRGSWILYDWIGLEAPYSNSSSLRTAPLEPMTDILEVHARPMLVKKDGTHFQPVSMTVLHIGDPLEARVEINGKASDGQTLRAGLQTITGLAPAVEETGSAAFDLKVAGKTLASGSATLEPVRKWELYLVHHTHLDIGFTHLQSEVEANQWKFLDQAMELARASADYPPGSRFKWNPEGLWAVDSYLEQATPEKAQAFIDAVGKGWIGLDALYGNELTALCRPEELFELTGYAQRLSSRTGLTIDSAMISDVPGLTWGIVPALAHSGVKYLSVGPNSGHRIGYTLSEWGDKPFYWLSPSGRQRILCWMAGKGYSWFHRGRLRTFLEGGARPIFEYLEELDDKGYPYDMVQLRYSIGGDNGPPDPELADLVRDWNARYAYPKIVVCTTHELFKAFEGRYGDKIPEVRGDFTPYWEDGAASSSRETALNRGAAERLVQAQALWALLDPDGFPAEAFHEAWRNLILYDEHTWGAWNSISQPESDFAKGQWRVKQAFAVKGDQMSRRLLNGAIEKYRVEGDQVERVLVFNTLMWPRTDLVTLPRGWNLPGDLVRNAGGDPVPSQRLTTGELTFLAKDIPALGMVGFTVHSGEAQIEGEALAEGSTLRNGLLSVTVNTDTGGITSIKRKGFPADFVNSSSGSGLNDYFYVAGRDPDNPKGAGPTKVILKERGPLVVSFRADSEAPGCHALFREVRLVSGLDRVDLIDLIDKKKIYSPEGVHLAFPFNVRDGVMRMDGPWSVVQPEKDQLPGACKNYFTVQRWVDISNADSGVTWATLDAPLVEVGAISADPIVTGWIKKLKPSTTLYSYVMNNYWETNYKAAQEGAVVFRYSLKVHGPYDPASAHRFGIERGQPLIAVPGGPDAPASLPPVLTVRPGQVLLTCLKPSADRKAWILRLYNTGRSPCEARLEWSPNQRRKLWRSNAKEESLLGIDGPIELAPQEIVTIRAGRASG